jgi:hypothetical protein
MWAVSSILALVTIGRFQDYWETPYGSFAEAEALDDWIAADDTLIGAMTLMSLGMIVAFVLLVIWTNHAHKATQDLWSGDRRWSSGWTVGGWFIPVANLIIPRAVITEIERLATSPRTAGRVGPRWNRQPTAAIGWVWWIAFAGGWILNAIGTRLGSGPESSSDAVTAGYALSALGLGSLAVGAACGALFIRRIGQALGPEHHGAGDAPLPPTADDVRPTVRFSTARWSTSQLSGITTALTARGVSFTLSEGDLVVHRDAMEVTDTVVAEFTIQDDRWI